MSEVNLTIEGMSCQHCVMHVKKAVDQLPGVSKAEVSVGAASITYDESVEGAGYKIRK